MESSFINSLKQFLQNKKTIFIYIAKKDEIETRNIINFLIKNNFKIIVPKCQKNEIIPIEITNLDQLKKGTYGIYEPISNNSFNKENIDLYIIPGKIFDKNCNRKGRGKGFFDRFLQNVKNKKTIIGLCYENQLVNKLKTNSWDIPVDVLITEKKIIKKTKFIYKQNILI
jgi:5-formyltetrahydrofolate cyclo-ligase